MHTLTVCVCVAPPTYITKAGRKWGTFFNECPLRVSKCFTHICCLYLLMCEIGKVLYTSCHQHGIYQFFGTERFFFFNVVKAFYFIEYRRLFRGVCNKPHDMARSCTAASNDNVLSWTNAQTVCSDMCMHIAKAKKKKRFKGPRLTRSSHLFLALRLANRLPISSALIVCSRQHFYG